MATPAPHTLSLVKRLSYGVGHVLNDLTASMWFSYLLVYLHQVKNFNNKLAGDLMLIGQVSDALATPFIGYESDRTNGFCKMGRRKSWHFVGTICVMVSFSFLFNGCITCDHAPDWAQFIYFIPFVVIFQFGWASTQISHLSLIPDLTPCENERVGLNGLRYAFTVLSNLTVYAIAWLMFALGSKEGGVSADTLTAADAPKFRNLVFIVLGIGIIFSLIFHLGTRERPRDSDPELSNGRDAMDNKSLDSLNKTFPPPRKVEMHVKDWLKEPQFYMIGLLYMSTRLYVNLSQVYLPMYLLETLKLDKTTIAIVPLIVYVSGFVTSLVMKPVNKLVGRKFTYVIGVVFAVGACVWLHFIQCSDSTMVYGAAVFIGIGGSTMLITSLAMTSDLIGDNTESGAFVFGAMSFTDKLSNGIGVEIIQVFHPCVDCCPLCEPFYRMVQAVVPGSCALVGLVALLLLLPQKIGQRKRDKLLVMKPTAITNGGGIISYDEEDDERSPLIHKSDRRTPTMTNSVNTPPPEDMLRHSQNTPVSDIRRVNGGTRIHGSMNNPPSDVGVIS